MKALRAVLSLATLFPLACGGGDKPVKAPTEIEEQDDGPGTGTQLDVSAEVGALDEGKVTKVFEKSIKELQGCLGQGARRVEFIGGGVAFFVKVDQSGRVSHAHLERSTIGDRDTEKCMLGVLQSKEWPAPVGGKVGIARNSFDFDPPNDVRPAEEWSADKVSETLDAKRSEISQCKSSAPGSYEVTLYVKTDGRALAVGVTPPDERGEAAVDCLVETLMGAEFPKPGSWPAKVSFSL
ncbi:MAG: AgmX/PglI C-terminal domain-containing protein [Polyangiaceae bacterium]